MVYLVLPIKNGDFHGHVGHIFLRGVETTNQESFLSHRGSPNFAGHANGAPNLILLIRVMCGLCASLGSRQC